MFRRLRSLFRLSRAGPSPPQVPAKSPFELTGRSIRLRDWKAKDLDLLGHWLKPGHPWQDLNGPYYPRRTTAELELMIDSKRRSISSGKWPVPRKDVAIAQCQSDDLLGRVIWYWQSQETFWLSLGIQLWDPALWGRGLGYEALGLWSGYLLAAMPELARLDLRTWSGNERMIRLAEKLGYREEARFRKARLIDGKHYDALGFGVLREEWQERYPGGFAADLGEA